MDSDDKNKKRVAVTLTTRWWYAEEKQEKEQTKVLTFEVPAGVDFAEYVERYIEDRLEKKADAVRIPTTTSPFDGEGNAVVGNNPPCSVLFQAITKGGKDARKKKHGWTSSTINTETPVFRTPQRTRGDWTVFFDMTNTPNNSGAWSRVEGLSPLHTKLGLFCLAKICDPRNQMRHPAKDPVGVSYEDLRRALGLRGKPMAEFKPLADRLVRDLADLKATVRGIMINGQPDGIAECALFVISKVWDKQFPLFEERVQIGWLFDPGPWARHYFNRDGRAWLSTLQRTILELDHRDARKADVFALHIATLLFAVAGGDQFKTQAVTRTVEDLLEIVGELPEQEERGEHWAGRTRDRLETALETLLTVKLTAAVEYGPTYPDPGDREKGWVERWLSATITLTSPEAAEFLARDLPETPNARQLPPPRERKRRKKTNTPLEAPVRFDEQTTATLRAYIAQNYPSHAAAAQHLGCSKTTLSFILNRARPAAPKLAEKLQAWLDSPKKD